MQRADHLPPLMIPLPSIRERTAASRVSLGSSPARLEASWGALCYAAYAELDPEPQVEASVGRSTEMLLTMAAMGGRGGHYGCRSASSYGICAAWSAVGGQRQCAALVGSDSGRWAAFGGRSMAMLP
jgi:hypothetical protein